MPKQLKVKFNFGRNLLIAQLILVLSSCTANAIELNRCIYLASNLIHAWKTQKLNQQKPDRALFVELKQLVDQSPLVATRVKVKDLKPLHLLRYDIGKKKLAKRTRRLERARDQLKRSQFLSIEELQKLAPSGFPMTAIQMTDGSYVVKNGNSRLHSIWEAFPDFEDLEIEILVHQPENLGRAQEIVEAIRRGNQ